MALEIEGISIAVFGGKLPEEILTGRAVRRNSILDVRGGSPTIPTQML
jgi:hypothetical protein